MMPQTDFRDRLDAALRPVAPFALSILAVFLACLPYRIPELPAVMPWLPLIAIYYWALARPDLLPAGAAFTVGLFYDLLSGGPLGLMALIALATHRVVVGQRRFLIGRPFIIGWGGFVVIAAGATLAGWLIAGLYYGTLPAAGPVAIQFLLTAATYPALAWGFGRLRLALVR